MDIINSYIYEGLNVAPIPYSPKTGETIVTLAVRSSVVDENLVNFPILVNLSKTIADWRKLISIRFYSVDGTVQYYAEIENIEMAAYEGNIWVKIPNVSSTTDTKFIMILGYMEYWLNVVAQGGDPPAMSTLASIAVSDYIDFTQPEVWDSNAKMIQHMHDTVDSNTTVTDSTNNDNTGVKSYGGRPAETAGFVSQAQGFHLGYDSEINFGSAASLNLSNTFTLELWSDTTVDCYLIGKYDEDNSANLYPASFALKVNKTLSKVYFYYKEGDTEKIVTWENIIFSEWTYYALTVSGTSVTLYIDGFPISTQTLANQIETLPSDSLRLASKSGVSDYFELESLSGVVDEVRVSDSARLAAWIKATYYSVSGQMLIIPEIKETILINHSLISVNLTNFPHLIDLSEHPFIWQSIIFDADRKRIKVTNVVEDTEYYAEWQQFDSLLQTGILWVQIPSISSTEDTLFVLHVGLDYENTSYIGDTGNIAGKTTWDANFKGIYHLNGDYVGTIGEVKDSGQGEYHMKGGSVGLYNLPTKVDGKIGYAPDFDSDSTSSESGYDPSGDTALTFEAIFKCDDTNPSPQIILFQGYQGLTPQASLYISGSRLYGKITLGDITYGFSGVNIALDTWNYVAMAWESGVTDGHRFIINGSVVESNTRTGAIAVKTSSRDTIIGNNDGDSFNGIIDETRVSNIKRSDAWLMATYYTCFRVLAINSADLNTDLPTLTCGITAEFVDSNNTGDVEITMPTLSLELSAGADLTVEIPSLTCTAYGLSSIDAELPALLCSISGAYSLDTAVPPLSMTGEVTGGSVFTASLSAITASMIGVSRLSVIDCEIPAMKMEAESYSCQVDIACELPDLIMTANVGALVTTELPVITAVCVGFNSKVANINAMLPRLTHIAYSGVYSEAIFPSLECSVEASTPIIGNISANLAALSICLNGDFKTNPKLIADIPALQATGSMNAGAISNLKIFLPKFNLAISSITGELSDLIGLMPSIHVKMTTSESGLMNIKTTLPNIEMLAAINNENKSTILRHIRGEIR